MRVTRRRAPEAPCPVSVTVCKLDHDDAAISGRRTPYLESGVRRVDFQKARASRDVAMERLRLVVVHDRAMVSPALLEVLKGEMIEVISRYLEIDEEGMEIHLSSSDQMAALVANIPVRRVRRGTEV